MIKPTVGRKIWYRPTKEDIQLGMSVMGSDPLDATVVAVWKGSEPTVNLVVLDSVGNAYKRANVQIFEHDYEKPKFGGYAEWMPFQLGQAQASSDVPTVGVSGGIVSERRVREQAAMQNAGQISRREDAIQGIGALHRKPTEDEIKAVSVAPRVTQQSIDSLMKTLVFRCAQMPNSTTTVVTASLPNGFAVGKGFSGCVNPANFNEGLGRRLAEENALKDAESELWKLEGYRLAMGDTK